MKLLSHVRCLSRHLVGTLAVAGAVAIPALDLDGYTLPGDPLRSDRVWRAGGSWTLPVLDGQLPRLALDLHVEYFFTRHGSNDFLYNYSSHSLGIGATVSY